MNGGNNSEHFHTSWEKVFRAVEMAVEWGRAHQDLSGITALGIDEGTAERDAEGIEHYVSEATIQAFQDWTGKIRS